MGEVECDNNVAPYLIRYTFARCRPTMEQEIRALIGWMDRDEAVATLLGHLPGPAEDVTAQVGAWEAARDNVQQREAYSLGIPLLEPLPEPLTERGVAFRQRADVTAAFANFDWTLGMANLQVILSFQKTVVREHAVDRVSIVDIEDQQALFSLCLPDPQTSFELSGQVPQDKKSVAFASLNPNLRAVPQVVMGQQPGGVAVVGFPITFGTQHVQIAQYQGRWFIRDGYHRCYGLLCRGVQRIPCIFIRARDSRELFGPDASSFFGHEILFGARPPFIRDFLTDEVSVSARRKATRKVIRISAEEFQVEI